MHQGDTQDSEDYMPIGLTVWCETEPTSTRRILQADLERRCVPATVEVRRRFVLRHFEMGLYQEIYAVVRPLVPVVAGVGIRVNKNTIDVIADLLTRRFTPKQTGITHTIFVLDLDGSVIRCLELKDKGQKDVTKRWEKRRPSARTRTDPPVLARNDPGGL